MEKRIGWDDEVIWYIAYGSNINASRFQEYLDTMEGRPSMPISQPFEIPFNIYFDRKSSRWNHAGVAFLDPTKPGFAYGKAYQFTVKQLYELQQLEGSSWYSEIIEIGTLEGKRCFTFTQKYHDSRNKPDEEYLNKIKTGISLTHTNISQKETDLYILKILDN
jgi:hypothetical protein